MVHVLERFQNIEGRGTFFMIIDGATITSNGSRSTCSGGGCILLIVAFRIISEL